MARETPDGAGAIDIDELYITLAGNVVIDLREFFQNIKIYENIFQHCLFVEMAISDSANILGRLDISGSSTVTMKVRSPFLDDEEAYHKTFSIFSVSDRLVKDDRKQYFVLNLISIEGMKDLSTKFSRRFKGSTEKMAKDMYEDFIQEKRIRDRDGIFKNKTPLTILGTPHKSNNFTFTATNWSAFECMEFIAKNIDPADVGGKLVMPNSLFFETRTEFVMGSLTELIVEQKNRELLYDEYNLLPSGYGEHLEGERKSLGNFKYTSPFVSPQYSTVLSSDMKNYFNELDNQQSGYYGSTTVGIDMITKQNYHMVFDYTSKEEGRNKIPKSYDDFVHLSEDSPIEAKPIFSPAAIMNVRIGASNLYNDSDFGYNLNYFENLTYRNTAKAELKRISMRIEVPGKTDMKVGSLIRFNFPSVGEKTKGMSREELFDPKISGIWAVSGVLHDITPSEHKMTLNIVRDAYGDTSVS
jgi:hypothetical protein|tara:strand:+ start:738 stop:2147 length:1410 start_codon:yes stop_codon:yes gene_type:complete